MSVAKASATIENGHVNVRVGEVTIRFEIAKVGGAIDMGGTSRQFANALVE